MDWSIPQTFYPIALPVPVQWLLFGLVCFGTAAGIPALDSLYEEEIDRRRLPA